MSEKALMILPIILLLIIAVLIILVLFKVVNNNKLDKNIKAIWMLLIIVIPIIGSVAYLVTNRKK